jgi:hypothetical protein
MAKTGRLVALTPKSWLSTNLPQSRPVITPAAIPKRITGNIFTGNCR